MPPLQPPPTPFPTRRSSDLTCRSPRQGLIRRLKSHFNEWLNLTVGVGCPVPRNGVKTPPACWLRVSTCEEIHVHASHTAPDQDRKSTRLNSSHLGISYAVFC